MSTQISKIADAYAYCEELTRQRESNFSLGFQFLPAEKKKAIHVVYAACRYADDLSDEPADGDVRKILSAWRRAVEDVYSGATLRHPICIALKDVLGRFPIPKEGFLELIAGCVKDQEQDRYDTFGELSVYCDLVATSIAKVSLPIYEYTDYAKVFPPARDLSFAFQLTNILRDVAEDLRRGRRYLPAEDLERFGLHDGDFLEIASPDRVRSLYDYCAARAEAYFQKGEGVLQYLRQDSHRCVRTMAAAYHTLLEKIIADPLRSLGGRTILTDEDKERVIRAGEKK